VREPTERPQPNGLGAAQRDSAAPLRRSARAARQNSHAVIGFPLRNAEARSGSFPPLTDLSARPAVTLWHTLEAPHALLTRVPFPFPQPTGAKLALKPFHVWGIRVRLQVGHRTRDLALFDLALDSKLRGCDLVQLKVSDLISASGVKRRVMILQQKTGRAGPVRGDRAGSPIDCCLDRRKAAWDR
jgi:hypothetical protein